MSCLNIFNVLLMKESHNINELIPLKSNGLVVYIYWSKVCAQLEPHAPLGPCVMAGLFSVQLLAWTQHPPWAQMLAHWPPQLSPVSPASHLSLAANLLGWLAGVENQPLMGLWGRKEGIVLERVEALGGAACTDWRGLTPKGTTAQTWHQSSINHQAS